MPQPINQTVADRIHNLRTGKHWTQEHLAQLTGLSATWICHFECGRRNPTIGKLAELAKVLGTTTDYLLGVTDHASTR